MQRLFSTASFLVLLSLSVAASEAANSTPIGKRQAIKECMTRQMIANKSVSYNEASKECTARVKMASEATASNNQVKQ